MLTVITCNVYHVFTVNIEWNGVVMGTYWVFKVIHLLGVILFLGNIIVTGWWKLMADRQGDPLVVAFAQRQVTLTDYVFTGTGVILVLVGGNFMLAMANVSEPYWISWGVWLFVASGLIWGVILIPVQIKQARMAKAFDRDSVIPEQYWCLSRRWILWGVIATVLSLINLYWMVFKPLGV